MVFKYYNPNPKGLHTRDCVVRAFAFFFGVTWRAAFADIIGWCADRGLVDFNFRSVYNEYLRQKGFARHRAPKKGMTVREFTEEFADANHTYIVSMRRHLTIVSGKCLLDIGDCSDRTVDGYWVRPGSEIL